jgi:hypothetical protein
MTHDEFESLPSLERIKHCRDSIDATEAGLHDLAAKRLSLQLQMAAIDERMSVPRKFVIDMYILMENAYDDLRAERKAARAAKRKHAKETTDTSTEPTA